MMAPLLYIFISSVIQQSQSFFKKGKKKKKEFRTLFFYNINIVNSLWCEKKKSL